MVGRGRRVGYINYSAEEQMLLCGVVEKIKPLGKDMWDDVATSYNTSRNKLWVERDSESLRRKPALWAKEIQFSIESSGGAHTAHDGLDDGDDDGELDEAVSTATATNPTQTSPVSKENPTLALLTASGKEVTQAPPPTSHNEVGEVDHDRKSEEGPERGEGRQEHSVEKDVNGHVVEDQAVIEDTYASGRYGLEQFADMNANEPVPIGTIITSSGCIDAQFAADYGLDQETMENPDHERGNDTTLASEKIPGEVQPAFDSMHGELVQVTRRIPLTTEDQLTVEPTTPSASTRRVGRPRNSAQEPIPTMATPEGPVMNPDPARAVADAREMAQNPNLSASSDRLGGRDLRVLRDNFQSLVQSSSSEGKKRSGSEVPGEELTYGKAKRVRAKTRVDEMQRGIENIQHMQSAGVSVVPKLMKFVAETNERGEKPMTDENVKTERDGVVRSWQQLKKYGWKILRRRGRTVKSVNERELKADAVMKSDFSLSGKNPVRAMKR
ncbi:hypothetical protein PHMEG_00020515 [Phytophthora megakarya]|uniref:DUF6818 domain-containing protein n=1 Tax=Phytophthora megakarya TaxID=4795 RepID=A0A225VNX9_9STRA|nr:hypothetical protein PHMEG_00020515 [Phytophthora megakarya]